MKRRLTSGEEPTAKRMKAESTALETYMEEEVLEEKTHTQPAPSTEEYTADPAGSIQRYVIEIGGAARGRMPTDRQKVTEKLALWTEDGRSRVFVRSFGAKSEKSNSDEEPVDLSIPYLNEEFAPDQDDDSSVSDGDIAPLTWYVCEPTSFFWKKMVNAEIDITTMTGPCSLELVETPGPETPWPAYLLPWSDECIIFMRLGHQSQFFFTDTMNGCTLAIGGDPASPLVAHSNAGFGDAQEQIDFLTSEFPDVENWCWLPKSGYISKLETEDANLEGYIRLGTQCNVIGWQCDSVWEFWAQRYVLYKREADNHLLFSDIHVFKVFP